MNLAFSSEMSLCGGWAVACILIRPRQNKLCGCKASDF
jgi:hypothetical protein